MAQVDERRKIRVGDTNTLVDPSTLRNDAGLQRARENSYRGRMCDKDGHVEPCAGGIVPYTDDAVEFLRAAGICRVVDSTTVGQVFKLPLIKRVCWWILPYTMHYERYTSVGARYYSGTFDGHNCQTQVFPVRFRNCTLGALGT